MWTEQALNQISAFIQQGGTLLWAILLLALTIFALFFERLLYLRFAFPKQLNRWQVKWAKRTDKHSWQAKRIRESLLAQGRLHLNQAQWLLKTCVMVSPLLGLTGTVTGMVLVFDNLSFTGTGNPRLMSSGIFQATIPTMAGMFVAIIGMILQQIISRMIRKRQHQLSTQLTLPTSGDNDNL